jgi:flagellar protein FliL
MSETPEPAAKPKKGKGLMVKLMAGLGLLGIGGGGAFAAIQAGMIGGGGEGAHAKEDNRPKLIRKGEEDPYAPKTEAKEGEGGEEVDGDGGSEYRTIYYSFADDFTSNLAGSEAMVQVSLACSTRRDGRVTMHELAIRSRMLTVIADTPEFDIGTLEGKTRLQKRLTAAINQVLTETEGFGGVDAVYFRNFIVQ